VSHREGGSQAPNAAKHRGIKLALYACGQQQTQSTANHAFTPAQPLQAALPTLPSNPDAQNSPPTPPPPNALAPQTPTRPQKPTLHPRHKPATPSSRTTCHAVPSTPLYGPTGTTVRRAGAAARPRPLGSAVGSAARCGLPLGCEAACCSAATWPRRSTVSSGSFTKSSAMLKVKVERE